MSTPIRPAGGPLAPGVSGLDSAVTGASDVEGSAGVASTEASASKAIDQAVSAPLGTEVHGATATLLARLEAGEVTREQAIDGLVREALDVHGGQALPPAQRAELEAVLRTALLDDPTLSRLLG